MKKLAIQLLNTQQHTILINNNCKQLNFLAFNGNFAGCSQLYIRKNTMFAKDSYNTFFLNPWGMMINPK